MTIYFKHLVNFLSGLYFPDLNVISYDTNNILKLDLNFSTKVGFNSNDQGL